MEASAVPINIEDEIRKSYLEYAFSVIFGREVDLVEQSGLRNLFRRRAILSSRQVLYGA